MILWDQTQRSVLGKKEDQLQKREDTETSYFWVQTPKLSTVPLKIYFQKLWISFLVET